MFSTAAVQSWGSLGCNKAKVQGGQDKSPGGSDVAPQWGTVRRALARYGSRSLTSTSGRCCSDASAVMPLETRKINRKHLNTSENIQKLRCLRVVTFLGERHSATAWCSKPPIVLDAMDAPESNRICAMGHGSEAPKKEWDSLYWP